MHCFCVRCSLQVFFNEIIPYLLIAFLLYHILIFAISVSKSTVARSMVPDFCWTCPLPHHWYEWLNVAFLHKDHLFRQLHLQHSSTDLLHFWIHKLPIHPLYKHRNCMDVFHCKTTNLFKLFCTWTGSGCPGYWVQQRCIWWKEQWCCCSFHARLIIFIVRLEFIDIKCLPEAGRQLPLQYCLQKAVFLSSISSWIGVYS